MIKKILYITLLITVSTALGTNEVSRNEVSRKGMTNEGVQRNEKRSPGMVEIIGVGVISSMFMYILLRGIDSKRVGVSLKKAQLKNILQRNVLFLLIVMILTTPLEPLKRYIGRFTQIIQLVLAHWINDIILEAIERAK